MDFEELVKKFSLRIKYLANRTFISSQVLDQEDLYQEMIYHLWERYRQGQLEGKTDAYIMTSCYFHLKNYLRRFKEKINVVSFNELINEDTPLEELIPDKTSLFDERTDDVLFIQQMKDKELSRREKEVMEFLSQDYTLREIGEKLGISHVRVLKIKKNILRKFKKEGYQKG